MLVGILKKLVGIMIGPVGILKNTCRYFETVGIMNVGIMNVGIMNVGIMNVGIMNATLIATLQTKVCSSREVLALLLLCTYS